MSKKLKCSAWCSSWVNNKTKTARRNKKQNIISKKQGKKGIQTLDRKCHAAINRGTVTVRDNTGMVGLRGTRKIRRST